MLNKNCHQCGSEMEEKEIGLAFIGFSEKREPLYTKVYTYTCPTCTLPRQVTHEGTNRHGG